MQTSIRISIESYHYVKENGINLSRWVENKLVEERKNGIRGKY